MEKVELFGLRRGLGVPVVAAFLMIRRLSRRRITIRLLFVLLLLLLMLLLLLTSPSAIRGNDNVAWCNWSQRGTFLSVAYSKRRQRRSRQQFIAPILSIAGLLCSLSFFLSFFLSFSLFPWLGDLRCRPDNLRRRILLNEHNFRVKLYLIFCCTEVTKYSWSKSTKQYSFRTPGRTVLGPSSRKRFSVRLAKKRKVRKRRKKERKTVVPTDQSKHISVDRAKRASLFNPIPGCLDYQKALPEKRSGRGTKTCKTLSSEFAATADFCNTAEAGENFFIYRT